MKKFIVTMLAIVFPILLLAQTQDYVEFDLRVEHDVRALFDIFEWDQPVPFLFQEDRSDYVASGTSEKSPITILYGNHVTIQLCAQ